MYSFKSRGNETIIHVTLEGVLVVTPDIVLDLVSATLTTFFFGQSAAPGG